jgi:hypothetical protein
MLKFAIPSSFSHIGVISCEELLNASLSEYEGWRNECCARLVFVIGSPEAVREARYKAEEAV